MSRSLRLVPLLLLLLTLVPGCATAPSTGSAAAEPPTTGTGPATPPEPPATTPAEPVEPPPASTPAPVEVAEPEPLPTPPPVCTPAPAPKPAKPPLPLSPIPILGGVETVVFDPPGLRLEARLDTGRAGSLLDARDVREFERDGKHWVRFRVVDRATGQPAEMSRPVAKTTGTKGTPGHTYVVTLRIRLGSIDQFTEFALVDRSKSSFPVLLGSRFLRDQALVDVARHHTVAPPAK